MGGIVHVFNLNYKKDRGKDLLSSTVNSVRKIAAERNVKVPNQMTFGGDHSGWTYISFTSNAVRDIIIEVLNKNGHPFMLDHEYTYDGFQATLKQLLSTSN